MSKKIRGRKPSKQSPSKMEVAQPPLRLDSKEKLFTLVVALCAVALYANTLTNQFALDDGLVLRDNKIVLKGISGIPDICTHDSFFGSIGDSENLSGGRYRPLSLVSFAIEVSLFGMNPLVHHALNVLFYALTCIVLLRLLMRFIFPGNHLAALIATLLFTFHPVHTEVVANIKSRDEILSLLFLLLTLHYLLAYLTHSKRTSYLLLSGAGLFLALLSKENGLIFIIMIPLTIYFFSKESAGSNLKYSAFFICITGIYVLIRVMMIGLRNNEVQGVMDNPYVLATLEQKYATILFVFLKYLQLLFYPYPLTYDYSFRQIPYHHFSDPPVLISALLYTGLLAITVLRFRIRDLICWCIIFYFGSIAIVSNVFFNVGTPMAERFLYQASVPFVIAITEAGRRFFALNNGWQPSLRSAGIFLLSAAAITSAILIMNRNTDWKSDETLFLHDVEISSGSARANTYAGIALVRLSDAEKDSSSRRAKAIESLIYFNKSLNIKDDYLPTLLNMGVAYSRIDSGEAAERIWLRAKEIEPGNSNFVNYDRYLSQYFYRRGMMYGAQRKYSEAVRDLEKAAAYAPNDANAWYNLGGSYFMLKDYPKARSSWEKALQLNPNLPQAKQGLMALPPEHNAP